jgi:hypothetical protein
VTLPMLLPADAGEPMSDVLVARSEIDRCEFPTSTRQVSLRNTGTNTLWISLDGRKWFDVACGTSWDDRVCVRELWYCTQTGRTRFAVIGLALVSAPPRDDDREENDRDDREDQRPS